MWFYANTPWGAELLWHTCLGVRACLLVLYFGPPHWLCVRCGAQHPYEAWRTHVLLGAI